MTRSFHATGAFGAARAVRAARWAVGGRRSAVGGRPTRFGKARQGVDS
jgi:hypothetical protein